MQPTNTVSTIREPKGKIFLSTFHSFVLTVLPMNANMVAEMGVRTNQMPQTLTETTRGMAKTRYGNRRSTKLPAEMEARLDAVAIMAGGLRDADILRMCVARALPMLEREYGLAAQ